MSGDCCIDTVDLTAAQLQGILQPIELVEESDTKDDKVKFNMYLKLGQSYNTNRTIRQGGPEKTRITNFCHSNLDA